MKVTFDSSSYIKKNHPDFYIKNKTITESLDGKVVNLFSASNEEICKLKDPKILVFKNDLKKVRQLLLLSFFAISLLSLLTVMRTWF